MPIKKNILMYNGGSGIKALSSEGHEYKPPNLKAATFGPLSK